LFEILLDARIRGRLRLQCGHLPLQFRNALCGVGAIGTKKLHQRGFI
jgi:hypothetical protein